jgi:hypothetical protein
MNIYKYPFVPAEKSLQEAPSSLYTHIPYGHTYQSVWKYAKDGLIPIEGELRMQGNLYGLVLLIGVRPILHRIPCGILDMFQENSKDILGSITRIQVIDMIKNGNVHFLNSCDTENQKRLLRDHLVRLIYEEATDRCRHKNAIKIQKAWRYANSSPMYVLCQKRLFREYEDMKTI